MPAQPNQSLINGISCLQTVVGAERPIGSREVARILNEEHTRVSRLLSTLASVGLLEQTPQRRYQPGPALHVLTAQSLRGSLLLTTALPHLKPLLNQGMTVALGVLWQKQVCFLFHSKPGQPMEESIGRHQLHPADRSSLGLALLAYAEPPAPAKVNVKQAIAREPSVPVENLPEALEGIRRLGYSRLRFPETGILSISVPMRIPPIAALGLSGPWPASETPRIVELLQQTAAGILADLEKAQSARQTRKPVDAG